VEAVEVKSPIPQAETSTADGILTESDLITVLLELLVE
jgi:hypothetical protein